MLGNNGFARPPSANRPPTSGVPIGMRPPSRSPGGPGEFNSRGINVEMRPTTKQGLPSANTQSGPRQVADRSYYIGVVRNKIHDTVDELTRLQKEIDNKKRGNAIQATLEQQVAELQAEINKNEAELADYNVLQDRVQSGISKDEMIRNFEEIEASNNKKTQEVNKLFREKKDMESIVIDQEKQVQEIMRSSGSSASQEMSKQIEELNAKCNELRSQTGDLQGKSREELIAIAKDYTTKIADVEKEIQMQQKDINYINSQIKSLAEREGEQQTERGQKYIKLHQKELQMTQFIANSPQTVAQLQADIAENQKAIISALEATSRAMESLTEMPSLENYRKLQNDLTLKERMVNDARATAAQLSSEVEARRRELDDLANVDQKIEKEMRTIKQQMEDMKREMPQFENVEQVRAEGEIKKQAKEEQKTLLSFQLEHVKQTTLALKKRYDEILALVRANQVHQKLQGYELELRKRAQENFTIQESIEENRRKTNYTLVKRSCLTLVKDINSNLPN